MSQAALKTELLATASPSVVDDLQQKPTLLAVPKVTAPTRPAASRALITTASLGLASVVLYVLLFQYADSLSLLAAETRAGHKLYALIPIGVAFLFSLIHGAFTGHFWDLLGLRAKGK